MLFAAGIKSDFALTAAGAEAYAARATSADTKATFLKLATAYRQLAEQMATRRNEFPSMEGNPDQLRLPTIWLGASFWGMPSNDIGFASVRDQRIL